jgi:hypothetical protein
MVAPITKELSTKLLRAVPLLKKLAANPSLSSHAAADSLGISPATLYQSIMPEFMNIYNTASREADFPSNFLAYYNQHGNTDPAYTLTESEAHSLKSVFERELTRKPEQLQQAYYSNPHPFQAQQQTFVPPAQEQVARTPNLSTNSALIAYIMERVRLAPIGQIQKFVQLFEMKEDYYMTHPEQLKELFKSQFGPLPGEIGFDHFMRTQPAYVYEKGREGYPGYPYGTVGGPASAGLPGFMGGPPAGMMPGMMANPVMNDMMQKEMYDEAKAERMLRHQTANMSMMTNAMMTNMMQKSMEAKQPIGAEGLMMGDIQEEFDSQGNLVGRKIIRKMGGPGGDNSAAMMMKEVVEMYRMQLQNEREEKKAVLQKSNEPNELLSGVFKTIIDNQLKMSPFEFVKGIREMGSDFFGSGRTRETIDADRDWELTLLKEKQSMMAMEHDWNIQDRANLESKEHMSGFISGLGSLVKDVIGPKVEKFMDGAMAQMNPGGGPQQQQPQARGQPQPQPQQPQIRLPQLAPGLRWVQTPQGLAIARVAPAPEAGMGQPATMGMGGGMPGAAPPGSFEESEEVRMAKMAENMNNFAHQLGHKEQALQKWEQELANRERSAQQAQAYAENKITQANEALRTVQMNQETKSFEEFTQQQLQKYYEHHAKTLEEIKKAISQKSKQELEAQAAEIAQDDTTPIAASDTEGVYEGEYEEDRDKLLQQQDSNEGIGIPSNASRDEQQPDTPAG